MKKLAIVTDRYGAEYIPLPFSFERDMGAVFCLLAGEGDIVFFYYELEFKDKTVNQLSSYFHLFPGPQTFFSFLNSHAKEVIFSPDPNMDARFLCRKTVSLIGYSVCWYKIPRATRLKDKTGTTHCDERIEINEHYLMEMLTDTQDVDKCRKELFQILKRVIFDEYNTFLMEQESIRCQAKNWFKNYFNETRRYGIAEDSLSQFFLPLNEWGHSIHKPLSLNGPRNQINTKHCVPWIDITDGALFFREQYSDIINPNKIEVNQ